MSTKQLKQALKIAWSHGEQASWPYKTCDLPRAVMERFYHDFDRAVINALCQGEAAVGPTCIYRTFDILIRAMMYHHKEDNQRLVRNVTELIMNLKSGDPYNETGSNLIYTPDAVACRRHLDDALDRELVHQLLALLKSYAELLYFRLYDIAREIHGPYALEPGGGAFMMAWNFRHLCPAALIPEEFLLPYDTVDFHLWYTDKVKIRLDIYNHVFREGGSLKEQMTFGSVLIDQKTPSMEELVELKGMLEDRIKKLYLYRGNLTDEHYTVWYIENLWYKIRKLSSEIAPFDAAAYLTDRQKQAPGSDFNANYRMLGLYF